jgi:hypothetical protein
MKTDLASSSLAVFDAMKGAGFAAMQALILAKMKHGRLYSRRQLAKLTKMETSSVSGRVNELIQSGAIKVCGTIRCPITGRNVEGIKRADEQKELFV